MDFVAFGELEFAEVVAQLDDLGRFEEGGLAGGGLVVDDTFDFASVGVEHGDDHAAVADGRFGVLGGPPFLFGASELARYLGVHLAAFAEHLAADVEEGVGGVVVDIAFVVDDFVEGLEDGGVEVDAGGEDGELRVFI